MGEALYEALIGEANGAACRVYAPVGGHRDLLAYLVRRLLENGANSSFVSVAADPAVPVAEILRRPQQWIADAAHARHPRIPLAARPLCAGAARIPRASSSATARAWRRCWRRRQGGAAGCAGRGADRRRGARRAPRAPSSRRSTARRSDRCRRRTRRSPRRRSPPPRRVSPPGRRGRSTERAAALERDRRSLRAEPRRACSRCCSTRAARRSTMRSPKCARRSTSAATTRRKRDVRLAPERMPGPTGETNELHHRGRGVFVCISPWNFPLAIFTGQIAAALVAGNAVVAKPAEQTPLIASAAVRLMHAGRHRAVGAAARARRRQGRRRAGRRSARRGRRLHGLDRGRAGDQPRARRQGRADRAADRRDRRHQRHDRRRDRAARAGDRRRHHLGVPLRRAALLGAAAPVRAGGRGRPHHRDDRRRGARARGRRSARDRDPCRAGDRRRSEGQARPVDRRACAPRDLPARRRAAGRRHLRRADASSRSIARAT